MKMIWFANEKNVFNEKKKPEKILLKVDLICCDLRELDLKNLSSNATNLLRHLVWMIFINFWRWDLKIKLFTDTFDVS